MHVDNRLWVAVGFIVLAMLLHLLGGSHVIDVNVIKNSSEQLRAWHCARPTAAAALFFLAYVAAAALSVPGAAAMTLAAGAIFGLTQGVLIVSFASAIGATLAFGLSRWLLGSWVQSRFGDRLAGMNAGVAKDGGLYLFTLRLVPVIPFFVINLGMGLTPIRIWTFYWVSQLGMLAGTLVYVNAGTQLARIDSLSGIASPPLIASLALLGMLPLVTRKFSERAQTRRAAAGRQRPRKFDRNLIVIGAGSAGLVTAYLAAALKAKVTLVERHRMGGDCLNTGCVPSKALIRSARFLSHVRRANEFGIRLAHADFDFAEIMERVQTVIGAIEPHDSVERFTSLGVEVVQGAARLVSPWEVEITRQDGHLLRLTTRSIVIATGARPFVPPIPGIEQVEVLTSDNVWSLRERPRRLMVLGGGPIGCELAQAFARLGCRVTQVEMAPRLLMREDEDASELVTRRFAHEGIDVRTGHLACRIEVAGGERALVAQHEGHEVRLPFDALLVAVGRTANLTGYGLEELGIAAGRTIKVDEFLQTNIPSIYAAGDVAGPYQFTHTAAHQAWYATLNALLAPFKRFRADYSVIPWATFVEPEVARVGLNELEACERNIPYEITRYAFDDLDRAITDGEAHGFVKVLTAPGKDRILGVTIVGEHAGELLAEYVLAMRHGLGLNKILGTIHTYPTLAEANKYVAGEWKRTHAPQAVLAWLDRVHTWRRG